MASTDAITFPAKSHTHSEYAAKSHTHAYLPTTGGTMTGRITKAGTSSSWQKGRDNAAFFVNSVSGYSPAYSLKTPNGSWEIGNYNTTGYENQLLFSYVTDTNYNGTNATNTQFRMRPDGYITGNITGSSGSCTGNSASASKVNNSLTIRLNGGTTEGSNQFTFNGSAAKTLSITASNIGAAASSHTHSYYPTANILAGSNYIDANSANANHWTAKTISFGRTFSSTPKVLLTLYTMVSSENIVVTSVSTTQFVAQAWCGTGTFRFGFYWLAII